MKSMYVNNPLPKQGLSTVSVRCSGALVLSISLLFLPHQLSVFILGITWLVTGCSCLYAASSNKRKQHKDNTLASMYFIYGGLCSTIGLISLAFREEAVEYLIESNAALLLCYAVFHLLLALLLYLRNKKNFHYSFILSVPAIFGVIMIIAIFTPVFSYETWMVLMALSDCFYSGFAIGSLLIVKRSQLILQ